MKFEVKSEEIGKFRGPYPPNCILWTTLPLISWIIPFIGHTGITELANKLPRQPIRLCRLVHNQFQ